MAFGFLKQMLESPGLSLLPLALRFGSSSLGCLSRCVLSQLLYLLSRRLGCLLCRLLSQLFYLLRCSLGCLLRCLLSKLFYLLGGNLGRLLCCLLRRRLSRIHFHLIERKRNANEVHVGIQRRAHQPLESLLLIRNQIP